MGPFPMVSHRDRRRFSSTKVVLVSQRVAPDIRRLRSKAVHQVLVDTLVESEFDGLRICAYSVQSRHFLWLCEAKSSDALSAGMRALSVRLARRLNSTLGRSGRLFVDRYHVDYLESAKQVRDGLSLVFHSARAAGASTRGWLSGIDPFSSGHHFDGWHRAVHALPGDESPPVDKPRSALLKDSWRKFGLLQVDETPERGFGPMDAAELDAPSRRRGRPSQ